MARVQFASVANQHDVPQVGILAVVTGAIKLCLLLFLIEILVLVELSLSGLDMVLLSLDPVLQDFCSAVGALVGVCQPVLDTLEAKLMFAVEVA